MKKLVKRLIVAAVWIALWQCLYLLVKKPVLLPSPAQTFDALLSLASDGGMWLSVAGSMLRVLAGFVLGMTLGCVFAAVTYLSDFLRELFSPLVAVIKATPVASFIILAFVWIPVNYVPVFAALLIVTPIFWTNIFGAAGQTDKGLIEMARVYDMKPFARLTKIYIPSVMPAFISSVTSSIGMAWKASIAAEVICRCAHSIGGGLYSAKISIDTDEVFAWTAVVIVLSLIFEGLAIRAVMRISRRWQYA